MLIKRRFLLVLHACTCLQKGLMVTVYQGALTGVSGDAMSPTSAMQYTMGTVPGGGWRKSLVRKVLGDLFVKAKSGRKGQAEGAGAGARRTGPAGARARRGRTARAAEREGSAS